MRDDRVYCDHILGCLHAVQDYVDDRDISILEDRKTLKAVLRELQELAESTKRLNAELKARHPNIEWQAINGFRNIIVHEYFSIDTDFVWDIVKNRLPELETAMLAIQRHLGE